MSNQDTCTFVTVTNVQPTKPRADDKTAEWVNTQHTQLESGARLLVEMAMTIGGVLCTVQEKNEQGAFLQWLGSSVSFSQKTAYRYMALYNNKDKVSDAKNLTDAYKKIEASMSLKKAKEQEEAEERVTEYNTTGKKPDGWRRGADDRLAKRMTAQNENESEEDNEDEDPEIIDVTPPKKANPKDDTKRSSLLAKKTEDKPENDPFMDDLLDYLSEQPNDNRRVRACKAVIRKCQEILDDCMA